VKVAVVQARTGSTRLPGKVLRPLAGRPVLAHVLERAAAVAGVERVCCAIPDSPGNDALAELASELGAVVVRGPEHDVLARYLAAARATEASVVMRITSDCPLFDPEVGARVLSRLTESGADYCSNLEPRSWPKGLDCEAFARGALERAAAAATEAYDREHVTPWLRTSPEIRRSNVSLDTDRYAGWRWTLDYSEDLAFLQAVFERLPTADGPAEFEAVRTVVEADPALAALNAHLV